MEQKTSETFFAVVMANALQVNRNSGTESIAIQLQATKNLTTGEECDRRFVGYLYLSSRAVENTITTLNDVFGYTEQSFYPLNLPETLQGKDCEITVVREEYNGKMTEKVQWFNKTGSFESRAIKPIEDSVAKDMCSRLDAYFKKALAGNTKTTPSTKNSGSEDENDLPF